MSHGLTSVAPQGLAESDPATAGDPLHRRRRLWVGLAILVLLLLVALLPPLIHLNRYGRRIAMSMSESLGRPVHLDNVSLGLLPMPHLTLENVVVSEDPAFGNEPTIRADTVEAYLRLSSLWRRQMEFSRVRFLAPSVNLVRNAEGRWNLEGVLVHASRVDTAPTVQQRAGAAPRFPYIEATGGRVNLKIGVEKKPFSLTDADFALWLPSPQEWSVRLTATPARTDTSLTDSGIFRLEGLFQRAPRMREVAVTLKTSWHDAPLGEASRLVTGEDQGWRGTLQWDATLRGSLGSGRLDTAFTVDDLRRADFVPARSLNLHLHCVALANAPAATLMNLACSLPTDGRPAAEAADTLPAGGTQAGREPQTLRLQAETVDLAKPLAAAASTEWNDVPLEWFASWARLFSPRIPIAPLPGSVEASLSRPDAGGWAGSVALALPLPTTATPDPSSGNERATERGAPRAVVPGRVESPPAGPPGVPANPLSPDVNASIQTLTATLSPAEDGSSWQAELAPTPLRLSGVATALLSGTATPQGYTWRAAGAGSPAKLIALATRVPPLTDGLMQALSPVPAAEVPMRSPEIPMRFQEVPARSQEPARFDVTCSRGWTSARGDQICTSNAEPLHKAPGKAGLKRRR